MSMAGHAVAVMMAKGTSESIGPNGRMVIPHVMPSFTLMRKAIETAGRRTSTTAHVHSVGLLQADCRAATASTHPANGKVGIQRTGIDHSKVSGINMKATHNRTQATMPM